MPPFALSTHPSRYKHWKLEVLGKTARLVMQVDPKSPLDGESELKLNSYDLGVDIELADAVERLRFEHPGVRAVVIESGHNRVFCAGANIPTLAKSAHGFKVNFCKYTNETRLSIEDASRHSGQKYLAALAGTCAGGGYELALACDRILLVDDGASAVSLPEVPLLGVLPGTGGLTRLVDKRGVRRDLADVLCTTSEGVRGQRALKWGLCDALAPKSLFAEGVEKQLEKLVAQAEQEGHRHEGPGIQLTELAPEVSADRIRYKYVELSFDHDARVAEIVVSGPEADEPKTPEAMLAAGDAQWSLRAFRELDDALLRARMFAPEVGVLVLKTRGDLARVVELDNALYEVRSFWLAREIMLYRARVLRRLDLSARSMFAFVDKKSCFGGSLLELALAADRIYMLDDEDGDVRIVTTALNAGSLPMSHGLSRIAARFPQSPEKQAAALGASSPIDAHEAEKLGLTTFAVDEIDWADEVRIAVEERSSMSPDALSAMEANLRFAGPETCDSKIFGRLSAWQNWVFYRPNATGERGALTMYGKPERPQFDWNRC
jgi:benzoyl-CoA-dihydrodiol lyase